MHNYDNTNTAPRQESNTHKRMPLSTSGYIAPPLGKVDTTGFSGMAQSGIIDHEWIMAADDIA